MKRVKTKFSSNSQLCHVWAQQNQEEGSGNNMFFIGDKIYSYGFHYTAAMIHKDEDTGSRFALVNSDTYSPTTNKHLHKIYDALNNLIDYWIVPDVMELRSEDNFNFYNDRVINRIDEILRTVKVPTQRYVENSLLNLDETIKESNAFFRLAGFSPIILPDDLRMILLEHLEFRLARYQELNTPEMIEKREIEKTKRDLAEMKKLELKAEEDVKKWRNGENYLGNHRHPYSLLRVVENRVQTSRGAEVPLSHALRLLTKIENGTMKAGDRIGHFTFEGVIKFDKMLSDTPDSIITIGCHQIRLSEAQRVLAPFRDQELTVASEA